MADFPGQVTVIGSNEAIITLSATTANAELQNHGQDGTVRLLYGGGQRIVSLDAGNGDLKIGGNGRDGDITLSSEDATDIGTSAQATIHLDAKSGDLCLGAITGNGEIWVFPSTATGLGNDSQARSGSGDAGDVELRNADAVEDFEVMSGRPLEPAT